MGINFQTCWCNISIALKTSNAGRPESKAISKAEGFAWEHGRASRLHTKGGIVSIALKVARHHRFILPPVAVIRKGNIVVVSEPRETEGQEKDEGSLSIFIVPFR